MVVETSPVILVGGTLVLEVPGGHYTGTPSADAPRSVLLANFEEILELARVIVLILALSKYMVDIRAAPTNSPRGVGLNLCPDRYPTVKA